MFEREELTLVNLIIWLYLEEDIEELREKYRITQEILEYLQQHILLLENKEKYLKN